MTAEHWVTHEQLDTPLCDLFPGTRTVNTARQHVFICEVLLKLKPTNLNNMSYKNMNKYMDNLDLKMQELNNK
jgi:exopolysaccharide biosynthesis predicted pyruvyltransferase EpsI